MCARTPVGPVSWPVQERKPHLHNVMHCKTGALFSVCRFGVQILSYVMNLTCAKEDPEADMAAMMARQGALTQQTSAAQAHADNKWPEFAEP